MLFTFFFHFLGKQTENKVFCFYLLITWPRPRATSWSSCSDMPRSTCESAGEEDEEDLTEKLREGIAARKRGRAARARGAKHTCWISAIEVAIITLFCSVCAKLNRRVKQSRTPRLWLSLKPQPSVQKTIITLYIYSGCCFGRLAFRIYTDCHFIN